MNICVYEKCNFCVVDLIFGNNNKVNITLAEFDEEYDNSILLCSLLFWKRKIHALLYKTTECVKYSKLKY